jgi:hypothetical protein
MCKLIARDYMGSHRFRNTRIPSDVLRMEHHVIRMRTIYAWLSRHALKLWSGFVGRWWQCLQRTNLQLKKTLLESWHKLQLEDFLGCLGASIACIGVGRTGRLLGNDCIKDIPESAVWSLKRWQIETSRFGMLSSEWRELTMTLTCCSSLRCLQDLRRDKLLRWTLRLMATCTTEGITSPMVSIRGGLHLWWPILRQPRRSSLTLLSVRSLVRRM